MSTNKTKAPIKWSAPATDLLKLYNSDLTGKVMIVTGSNSGIGLETARVLALGGARVIIPCRTLKKSNEAIEHIKKTVPKADLIPMQLDLSDMASIKSFAQSFLALDIPLHVLINNAGLVSNKKEFTKDGFELQFGVNHLGHFYLTQLLTDKIKASAPSRIINVSSCTNVQFLSKKGIDFDNLNGEKEGYSPMTSYATTKLANIYHARELQRRFDAEGVDVTVVSLHPGNIMANTGLNRNTTLGVVWDTLRTMRNYRIMMREGFIQKTVEAGASTTVQCAIADDVVKGKFYSDNMINTDLLHEEAENEELAKKLWDISERLLAEKS